MLRTATSLLQKFSGENPDSMSSLSFAFLFKSIFSSLPPPERLQIVNHSPDEVRMLYNCCFLSKMVYVNPNERPMPYYLNHIVYESKESSMYLIPYFIVNSDELNLIFVTCRGSYCFNDFLVDIKAGAIDFQGGKVHQGVFITAHNVYARIKPLIMKLSHENNNRPIIITGHSLGGGVAATICQMFYHDVPTLNVKSVIFAPCASFCKKLWEFSLPRIRSYVVDGDFVPFLSLHNIQELPPNLIPSYLRSYLDKAIQHQMGQLTYTPDLVPPNSNPFQMPPPSIDSILNDDIDNIDKPVPLYPPGDCFLISLVDQSKEIVKLFKVRDYRYFGHFHNSLNELRHMMGVYKEWIEKFCEKYFEEHPGQ